MQILALLILGLLAVLAAPSSCLCLNLTPDEQEYVRKHPSVTLCVDPDWTPFERINQSGEHEGIAADLLALVSQRTGLRFSLVRTPSWDDSLTASQEGRCEVLSFLNYSPKREKWLTFTSPLLKDQNVFITREEHPFIADPEGLSGESIALPRGTFMEEMVRKEMPYLRIILTKTENEAVQLVSERKAHMTLRSLIVAAYTIASVGLFNLKISGQAAGYANQLRMGVIHCEPTLLGILEKRLN